MPDRDRTIQVVGEWIAKAENDFRNASHTLKIKANCPTDTVCFHAQQCVEKYLKAILVWEGVDFPKVHDIEEIISLLPKGMAIPLSVEEQGKLTNYAVVADTPAGHALRWPKPVRRLSWPVGLERPCVPSSRELPGAHCSNEGAFNPDFPRILSRFLHLKICDSNR